MSKKDKKIKNVNEAVGDTSGFNENIPAFDKKRKITLIASLIGIVVLVVFSIIFLTTPVKAEFIYRDGATKNERFQVSRTDGLLEKAPKDPSRNHYYFAGWYLNDKFTIGGLYNNDEDQSLLEYTFKTSSKITLYAKWLPTEYKVTYDVKGNANINDSRVSTLNELNSTLNPTTYSLKHTLEEYEKEAYVEYLRELDPETYINSPNAQKNITDKLEFYSNEAQKASINLKPLSMNGWIFVGWFDDEGNEVTSLSKLDPKEINLTAKWEQN